MTLDDYDILYAKQDLRATEGMSHILGNNHPFDAAHQFRQSLTHRTLQPMLKADDITDINDPLLLGWTCNAYLEMLHTAQAISQALADPSHIPQMQDAMATADSVMDQLEADAGPAFPLVGQRIYQAIERNWPHADDTYFPRDEVCMALGAVPGSELPGLFSNPHMETERRQNFDVAAARGYAALACHAAGDTAGYKTHMDEAARAYVTNSLYEMAAVHNRDMDLGPGTMSVVADAYIGALALARWLQAEDNVARISKGKDPLPVTERDTVDHLQQAFYESASRSQGTLKMMLGPFDQQFFADAIAARVTAAIDADDHQALFLKQNVYAAFGLTGDEDPAPDTGSAPNPHRLH